jgi:hypothetical protein
MPEQNSNTLDEIMTEVYRAIYAALESRLHLIGSVIDAESRKEILAQQIYDKGDFYGNTGYLVETSPDAMILRVGSNARHEPFAITLNPLQARSSGNPICPPSPKVPSWTPIAPLIAWVERKHLSWTDKRQGSC